VVGRILVSERQFNRPPRQVMPGMGH
jgi:hypothetical protein